MTLLTVGAAAVSAALALSLVDWSPTPDAATDQPTHTPAQRPAGQGREFLRAAADDAQPPTSVGEDRPPSVQDARVVAPRWPRAPTALRAPVDLGEFEVLSTAIWYCGQEIEIGDPERPPPAHVPAGPCDATWAFHVAACDGELYVSIPVDSPVSAHQLAGLEPRAITHADMRRSVEAFRYTTDVIVDAVDVNGCTQLDTNQCHRTAERYIEDAYEDLQDYEKRVAECLSR